MRSLLLLDQADHGLAVARKEMWYASDVHGSGVYAHETALACAEEAASLAQILETQVASIEGLLGKQTLRRQAQDQTQALRQAEANVLMAACTAKIAARRALHVSQKVLWHIWKCFENVNNRSTNTVQYSFVSESGRPFGCSGNRSDGLQILRARRIRS